MVYRAPHFSSSCLPLAATVAALLAGCAPSAPSAKSKDKNKEGGAGTDTTVVMPYGTEGLCEASSLTDIAARLTDGASDPSFVGLALEDLQGEGGSAAKATKVRLTLPELTDAASAHFNADQAIRRGYQVQVGMLPTGKYNLTVELLDDEGAVLVTANACLAINPDSDYVFALTSDGGTKAKLETRFHDTPGANPFEQVCSGDPFALQCGRVLPDTPLKYCTIPAKGDTPTGFNAIDSECRATEAILRASCTSRAVTLDDVSLVKCAEPTYTTSDLDADQVVLNHLWNEKDGVKCGGFDVSYVVETGHLKIGLCAKPSDVSLTWSTKDLSGDDKTEFEALLGALDGSHAEGDFCDVNNQTQLDATGGAGIIDTSYVVFKKDGGASRTLLQGDFTGSCAKFKPEALDDVLAFLRGL